MKITIMNADMHETARVPELVRSYIEDGHATGDRPRARNGVIYANRHRQDVRSALVWGDREHIRVAFSNQEADHAGK